MNYRLLLGATLVAILEVIPTGVVFADPASPSFNRDIGPLLASWCADCIGAAHNADEPDLGLRLG